MGICGMALTLGSVEIFRWNKYEVTTMLPSGYTPVEYIESSGTQYIVTGFIPNNNTRVVADIDVTPNSGETMPFGSSNSNGNYYYPDYVSGSWYYCFGTTLKNIGVSTVGRIDIETNKNVLTVDGTSGTATAQTFSGQYPIALFAVNIGGNFSYTSIMKLYSCRIYDNGTLVRDFVPCTNASGTTGLYDLVNNVFYANDGTGTFVAGTESENVVVGDFIEQVKSLNSNAYPDGGVQDGYYYERVV